MTHVSAKSKYYAMGFYDSVSQCYTAFMHFYDGAICWGSKVTTDSNREIVQDERHIWTRRTVSRTCVLPLLGLHITVIFTWNINTATAGCGWYKKKRSLNRMPMSKYTLWCHSLVVKHSSCAHVWSSQIHILRSAPQDMKNTFTLFVHVCAHKNLCSVHFLRN